MITCPFCGKGFEPEDILFCDTVRGHAVEAKLYDSVYGTFLDDIISFNPVTNGDDITVEMEKRELYYFHPWSDKNRKDKPLFQMPVECEYGNCKLYPARIKVVRNNGLTPRMEANEAEQDGSSSAPIAFSIESELTNGQFQNASTNQSDEDRPNFQGDVTRVLTTKACPRCHCYLPDEIGCHPLHSVVMLGSTRAGKTTYMTMAAHQATSGVGLPAGLMSCSLSDESKRYFDYLIKCMKYGILPSTPLDDKNNIHVVFPLLFTVVPQGGLEPFFLSIHDCPGEAMQNNDYLSNFPVLGTAEGAIMMLDPFQFLKDRNAQGLSTQCDTCTESFNSTLNLFEKNLSFFKSLQQLVFALTKFDLIYGDHPDNKIHPDDYPYMDQMSLDEQHENGVDLEWIRNLSTQVRGAIANQLEYPDFENRADALKQKSEALKVTTLCCSTQSWNDAAKRFVPVIDKSSEKGTANMIGYRLLEPLLCVLAANNLLPVKDSHRKRKRWR